jgi:low temperature requirement protein LtrA
VIALQPQSGRVTTLELFFDLVFVFTITQLTTVLVTDPTPRGVLRVTLMLGVIWWMYGGYAWLTNAVAPDATGRRLLLLGGMAGFLILALAIPRAFSGGGPAFGLAYLVVVGVHAVLFTRTSSESAVRAILRIAPFNILSALLILAGGVVGGPLEYGLWALAFALEWVTPSLADTQGFEIGAAHFVERHGLVVLVAIGESVVAIGIGAAGLPIDAALVGVAVLGLLLNACLWWTYFGGDDDVRAEHALEHAPPSRRPTMALHAFGYWHLPLLFGVIAIAAGLKTATGRPFAPLEIAEALELAAGVALFLVAHALFCRTLAIPHGPWRAVAATLALLTIPLGLDLSALAQLAALVALLVAALVAEEALTRCQPLAGLVRCEPAAHPASPRHPDS